MTQPARLVRLTSVARRVLDELHRDALDNAAQIRVDVSYQESLRQLHGLLSDDLRGELDRLVAPMQTTEAPPAQADLRLAEAQLAGWLQGLLDALQAGAAARGMAAPLAPARPQPTPPTDPRGYR